MAHSGAPSPTQPLSHPRVLHLFRSLHTPPVVLSCPGVCIRPFRTQELDAYLALFGRAFRGLKPPVRPWDRRDFHRQMTARPWWSPENCLLAWSNRPCRPRLLGSVTLVVLPGSEPRQGAVHWLMVAPEFRRRGLARVLLSHLEQRAWDQGVRLLRVETHACWHAAVAFYRRCGYRTRQ